MSDPIISVVMSVYNGEKYLKEAIDSILSQSYTDFEFLIVDDGSTDKSLEIISSYEDKRILLIKNVINLGLAKSLNSGIKHARGKYIARMDADDIALPSRLDKQFSFMEKNDNIDICGSWVQIIGQSKGIVWKYPVESDDIKIQLLFNSAFAHPTVFFRKNSFLDRGLLYDESIKSAQDYELWNRVAKCCEMKNIPEVLLHYRLHQDQVGKQYKSSQIDTAKNVRVKLLRELGLDVTNEDYEVHSKLAYFQNLKCEVASAWLVKLIEANKTTNYCGEKVFNNSIIERYWNTCSHNLKFLDGSFRIFLNTPIQKYASLSYKAYVKHWIKYIIRGKI